MFAIERMGWPGCPAEHVGSDRDRMLPKSTLGVSPMDRGGLQRRIMTLFVPTGYRTAFDFDSTIIYNKFLKPGLLRLQRRRWSLQSGSSGIPHLFSANPPF
jgi:hypothetical protein